MILLVFSNTNSCIFLTKYGSCRCVASGKVKREELFVVTKLPLFAMRPEDVPGMFQRSLDDLGLEYIDLYLVHSPLGCEKDEETNHIKFVNGKVEHQQLQQQRQRQQQQQ